MQSMKTKSVLIVDDDVAFANVLAQRFSQLGLSSRIARDASCAAAMLADGRPDLIVLDIEIPTTPVATATRHGLNICEGLRQSVFSDVPTIVLSGGNDKEIIFRCRRAGAFYVQKSPNAWLTVQATISRLLNLEPSAPKANAPHPVSRHTDSAAAVPSGPRILCVDDDPDINLAVGMRLRQLGAYPIRAFSGAQGFQAALFEKPDLIITDLHMPNGDGNHLIGRLKSNAFTRDIPVLVLTAVANLGVARALRTLGAEGILLKPLDLPMVIAELSRFVTLPNL